MYDWSLCIAWLSKSTFALADQDQNGQAFVCTIMLIYTGLVQVMIS